MAGVYIHIPFCHGKCAYCDFYSLGAPVASLMRRYVSALRTEWSLRADELAGSDISTVYIGGGTPSTLPLPLLRQIVEALEEGGIDARSLEEFTIEANPEDLTGEWLDAVRGLGINRVSIGIQSFSDRELECVSRRHTALRAEEALAVLSESGMNYSADLIYGLPGQTLRDWQTNLEKLIGFRPPHFSAYLLSYEPGTPLYARLQRGEVVEATDFLAEEMYHVLCQMSLDAGYRHYEISAFGQPGYEARHNSGYWNLTPYLGLGCAAHSLSPGGERVFNPSNILEYLRKLENNATAFEQDAESDTDRLNDYIITSLRTDAGLSIEFAGNRWGEPVVNRLLDAARPCVVGGRLEIANGRVRIPEHNWLTADAILRELIF